MSGFINYKLKDLLDIPKLQSLLDALDEIHSLPSAIIDAEGNILTATAWQDICTKFHRANPGAEKKCIESDAYIAKELGKHPAQVVYKCPFGLIDTATPIIVEGCHLGNVFTGQLFTEPPDVERFIQQAREYSFAEKDYLEALKKVPVISEERLRKNLAFLGRFTEMLATQGLLHKRQRKAVEALRLANLLNERVIRNAQEGLIIYGPDLRYQTWNPYMERLTGREASEVLGKHPLEVFPFLREAGVLENLEKALTGNIPDPVEFRYERPNGESVWANDMCAPLTNEKGEIVGVLGRVRDITERKKAEDDLRESEQRYRQLFEDNPHSMWVYDRETLAFLAVNETAVYHYGYSHAEFLAMTIVDLHRAEYRTAIQDAVHNLSGRVRKPGIWQQRKKNGTWIEVEITTHDLDFNGRPGRLVLADDVTAKRSAEAALLKSEARLREAQKIGRIGNWDLDMESGSLWWSDEVYELFGLKTGGGLTLETFLLRVHPEDRQQVNDAIQASIDRKSTDWQFEYRIVQDNGSVRYIHENATADLDAGGRVVRRRGIVQDITERKQVDIELQLSRQRLALHVQQTPLAVIEFDIHGCVQEWNPAAVTMFGFSRSEAIGQYWTFMVPKPVWKQLDGVWEALMSMKGGSRSTNTNCTKSGKMISCEWFNTPLVDSNGKTIGVASLVMDVSERIKAEQEMLLSEARYRRITEGLTDYQYTVHVQNGRIMETTQNPACESVTGYTPEEFAADPHLWVRMIAPEDRELVRDNVRLILAGQDVPSLEHRIIRKDGKTIWVSDTIIPFKDAAGNLLAYDGVIKDITERRKAEESVHKLSQAVEQSPVSIVITDVKGNIEFVNRWFTQVTGYEAAEVLGKNPRVLKSGETPPERYKELWGTITGGRVWEGEFHNKKKNGELFWEHAAISPIRDRDGTIAHFLGIKEDITEQKKLEEQLRQAQKMEAIGQLAGGVAHDFNNILTTITGYASLLEMSITSDATLREYATEITVASERGANLTQSLLAFSRKQEPSLAAVDLNDQIRSSHKVLSRLVGEDIDLVLDLDREETVVEADKGQLQQVLMNLASNARDAMPNGGTLRIATRTDTIGSDHQERYALEGPGKYVVLSVTDTGSGMEKAVRSRIFEPFYTTKGVGKGTGLGLSIVYGIVSKHRGLITVDSERGKGTTFSIYLPLSERSACGRKASEDLSFAAAGNRTILVVEDEEPVRRVLRLTLEVYGYRVIEAVDGDDAVRVFREHADEVTLVLCDLVMPKKNGRQACEEMMKIRPDVKTIFMSGYTKDIFDQKGISETDITLLVKPISPKELARKISEALEETHRPS